MAASKEYLHALRKRCDECGCLLIFDEIQTGFGRTGSMFRFQSQEVVPDILCLAKALGGGMPLGAFISSREIMHTLTYNPMLGHITTFGGHPVSCAAGLAAFQIVKDENLAEQAEEKAKLFRKRLQSHRIVSKIRNAGLMMAIDIQDAETFEKLFASLTKAGIMTDPFLFREQAFRIAPPLTISQQQINDSCDIILNVMDSL
jgi:acetylornithine/succinyldiaminopimelate/putrescine aminotransferase